MKQPKNDNRPPVLSDDITKAQHIVPANIIKKWKQDGIITGQSKNCPFDIKFRKGKEERPPQSENSQCFCVYHRWLQSVEKQKAKIENAFYQLVDECEKSQCNLIIDNRNQKEQEIILNYFYTMMICNHFKHESGNSYVKANLSLSDEEKQQRQKQIIQQEQDGYDREYFEKIGIGYFDADCKVDISNSVFSPNVYLRIHSYIKNNNLQSIWTYVRTKERLYLPDNWNNWQIVSVSPHSILISQYFINDLGQAIDLKKLDINNPDCEDVVNFVDIINKIALISYDKWIIF